MNIGDIQKQLVRLKRADDLGVEISKKIQSWSKESLDSNLVIYENGRGWYLELELKQQPPLDDWGMLFSDAVGQLRNTLDNMVFSVLTPLSDAEKLPNSKLIKFPVVTDERHWENASKAIRHIPEPYYSRSTVIHAVKPKQCTASRRISAPPAVK